MSQDLDRVDRDIVAALQQDARLSNKELAARVGLSTSSCLVRVRRLVERGVLRGVHADVDPKAMGVGVQALIAVRLEQRAQDLVETFRAHVLRLPEVVSVYLTEGTEDFLMHVAARDADHLRELVAGNLTRRPEVEKMQTSILFEHYRSPVGLRYLDAGAAVASVRVVAEAKKPSGDALRRGERPR